MWALVIVAAVAAGVPDDATLIATAAKRFGITDVSALGGTLARVTRAGGSPAVPVHTDTFPDGSRPDFTVLIYLTDSAAKTTFPDRRAVVPRVGHMIKVGGAEPHGAEAVPIHETRIVAQIPVIDGKAVNGTVEGLMLTDGELIDSIADDTVIEYLPPKPAVGCSTQCVGGYTATPFDDMGFTNYMNPKNRKFEYLSQYHCTAPGLSQIVTTNECTVASKTLGITEGPARESEVPFCVYDSSEKQLYANDGDYRFNNDLGPELVNANDDFLILCHCRSCDESSFESPWWSVLGVSAGALSAGGMITAGGMNA